MNTKNFQQFEISPQKQKMIKGGYIQVSGAEEGYGFIGTSVDIRLTSDPDKSKHSNFTFDTKLSLR